MHRALRFGRRQILPASRSPVVRFSMSTTNESAGALVEGDYRTRVYERYASCFQNAALDFNREDAARWGRAYHHYLRGWLPRNRDAAVVDLACGSGRLLHFFAQAGFTGISGVDISAEQVQLARQVAPDVAEGGVLEFLEDREGAFDLITGFDIIEHFRKDEVLRFLDGCRAALKPGGRLILQTPNADTPWSGTLRYGDFTHEVCFSPNGLGRLLCLCGFEQIEARELGPVPRGYSVASSMRSWLWRGIRLGLRLYNLAETGNTGSGVFTRVFLISGRRG